MTKWQLKREIMMCISDIEHMEDCLKQHKSRLNTALALVEEMEE